jgi:hypothetical protein
MGIGDAVEEGYEKQLVVPGKIECPKGRKRRRFSHCVRRSAPFICQRRETFLSSVLALPVVKTAVTSLITMALPGKAAFDCSPASLEPLVRVLLCVERRNIPARTQIVYYGPVSFSRRSRSSEIRLSARRICLGRRTPEPSLDVTGDIAGQHGQPCRP